MTTGGVPALSRPKHGFEADRLRFLPKMSSGEQDTGGCGATLGAVEIHLTHRIIRSIQYVVGAV